MKSIFTNHRQDSPVDPGAVLTGDGPRRLAVYFNAQINTLKIRQGKMMPQGYIIFPGAFNGKCHQLFLKLRRFGKNPVFDTDIDTGNLKIVAMHDIVTIIMMFVPNNLI